MSTAPRLLVIALAAGLAPVLLAQAPGATSITWRQGALAGSLGTASESSKQVLVYFWMNGSPHCHNLWGQTLTDPVAGADLAKFVCHSSPSTCIPCPA